MSLVSANRAAGAALRHRTVGRSKPSNPSNPSMQPSGAAPHRAAGDPAADDSRFAAWPIGIAVAVTAALVEAAARAAVDDVTTLFAVVLCAFALATTLPLALRTVAGALSITAACLLSVAVLETLAVAGMVAALLALYRLGRDGAPTMATVLAASFLVLALVGERPTDSYTGVLTTVVGALGATVAWFGSTQSARAEADEHREARRSTAWDLHEHTARGERARIARELHDVVAHHVSMVAVQAETARLTTPDMPAAGAERLLAIGDTARVALNEMRRLLGVLRADDGVVGVDGLDGVDGADGAERRPQPRLGELNELLDLTRDVSGSSARLILRGSPVSLDPGVELAGYRIVQEALTNARRHAPGAAIDVELHYLADELVLRVRDNGPGSTVAADSGGHGLTGMRERAAAFGGQLRTGPANGGGFLVEARLPATCEVRARRW